MRVIAIIAFLGFTLHAQPALDIQGVYDLIGQSRICSPDSVWVYGTFPQDNRTSYTAMAGGEPAPVNLVATQNGIAYEINILIPADLPSADSSVVILHNGTPSNVFPVTISSVCPAIAADGTGFLHGNGSPVTYNAPAAPGEIITLTMSGLGHTNPVMPLGSITSTALPAAVTPTVTVAGINSAVQFAGQAAGTVGYAARLQFIVPSDAPAGADPVIVSTSGVASNMVQLLVGRAPLPAPGKITGVANSASFESKPIAPGSFLTITFTGLAGQDNLSAFPATSVNGYSVQIGAWQAPIYALDLSAGLINVIVPSEAPPFGTLPLTIQGPTGPASSAIFMGPAGPGIFLVSDPSSPSRANAAALLNGTAWIVMPASQAQALGLPACAGFSATQSCGQPAHAGDILQVYVTGLGIATAGGDPNAPPLATGEAAPLSGLLYETPMMPSVKVNGDPANVLFSGVVPGFAGLYAIDFQVPSGTPAGSNIPLQISIGNSSVATATIAIQ